MLPFVVCRENSQCYYFIGPNRKKSIEMITSGFDLKKHVIRILLQFTKCVDIKGPKREKTKKSR